MCQITRSQKSSPGHSLPVIEYEKITIGEKPELAIPGEFMVNLKIKKTEETRVAVNKILDAQESELNELKDIRVKLAKKQFFLNVIEVAVSLASFSVSVAVSICSGGVTAPIAIITGLNLMLSVSNLACAYHNWNNVSNNKDELEMGSDAIQQAVFILAKHCQASHVNAKKIARFASYVIRVGLVVSLGVIGVAIQPAIQNSVCLLAKNYVPILSSMLSIITSGALGIWVGNHNDEKEAVIAELNTNEKKVVEQISQLNGCLAMLTELDREIIASGRPHQALA
ncbi:hypothetical protein [Yersinia rohdei]|uniref:hypothetical protein n=1 Tax=Yersinia rohdei TaxID=29485 RepID=UPI0005E9FB28|nr:hypothetical protein [Yersinia rohdei]CQJ48382.1 secretion system effector protein SseF [Yersinia rohdei]